MIKRLEEGGEVDDNKLWIEPKSRDEIIGDKNSSVDEFDSIQRMIDESKFYQRVGLMDKDKKKKEKK